jgi:hypothetical protein
MKFAAAALKNGGRLGTAQKLARIAQKPYVHSGTIDRLPGMLKNWTRFRDLSPVPAQSFRQWWAARQAKETK